MKVLDLAVGAYGTEVDQLQEKLQAEGYVVSPSEMGRSFFGPSTRAALLRWQKAHGLAATGILDQDTSAALSQPAHPTDRVAPRPATPPGNGSRPAFARAVAKSNGSTNPFVPTLAVAITSPADGAPIVGIDAGTIVTVTGTLTVSGLLGNITCLFTPTVTVKFGANDTVTRNATIQGTLDSLNGGTINWTYGGELPEGGAAITVFAHATLSFSYVAGEVQISGTEGQDAPSITLQPSTFEIITPTQHQVFIRNVDTQNCFVEAIGSTSDSAVAGVGWSLTGNRTVSGAAVPVALNNWTTWTAGITCPIQNPAVTFYAWDVFGDPLYQLNTPVNVGSPTQILDINPASYLESLVIFATQAFDSGIARITTDAAKTQSLTPDVLDGTFFESVSDILDPDNYAKANETVFQTRICIEVLRRFLAANPPTPEQAVNLEAAELAYRLACYLYLLNQAGTSYDEIRLARTFVRSNPGDQKKLQAICDRLGIDLGDRSLGPDHLDRLCFDPGGTTDSLLTFQLVVTDSTGATNTMLTNVTINSGNPPLTISAGPNQSVSSGSNVTLTGGAIETTAGATTTFQWTQIRGPVVPLNTPNATSMSFVAPVTDIDIDLEFQLTVRDSQGVTAQTNAKVTVLGTNQALTVNAGSSQTINAGTAVSLTGLGASSNPAVTIASYQWIQVGGPPVQVNNANTANATFVAPPAPANPLPLLTESSIEQVFGLVDTTRDPFSQGPTIGDDRGQVVRWNIKGLEWNRGTDADGITYVSIVTQEELDRLVVIYSDAARTNMLAMGLVGANGHTVLEPQNNSGVSGSMTVIYRADSNQIGLSVFPRLLSWQFQRLRRQWLAEDFPEDSVLTFQFTATDDQGASGTATVNVNVFHIDRPTATAGLNQTVSPGTMVNLAATGAPSVATGAIASYQWSQVSGPAVTLNGSGTATASFIAPAVTVDTPLVFQVVVTDSAGLAATTSVNVNVVHISRFSLTAGVNQIVNAGTMVTLQGIASDPNPGAALSYQWTQTAGPTVTLSSLTGSSTSFTAPVLSSDTDLTFQLTVTDASGAMATAVVNVTVYGSTQTLTATAGPGQMISEGTVVTLVGAATDSTPGATISYQWGQVSGPAVTINNAALSNAAFTAPAVDADTVLAFQLTATSSAGGSATVTAAVTVFPSDEPVVVSAGSSLVVGERATATLTATSQEKKPGANVISYQWRQIGGAPVLMTGADTLSASFVAPTGPSGPIIDPDLLINGDFKHRDKPPYSDLFVARQQQLENWLTELQIARQSGSSPSGGLDNMLAAALGGKQLSDLMGLSTAMQSGTDITPDLESLGLTLPAFNYLIELGTLVQQSQPLLDSEWNNIYSILIQAFKLQNLTAWRSSEVAEQLSLSPDYFQYPPALPQAWPTGLDSSGTPLAGGLSDPHWFIISTPSGFSNPPAASYVTQNVWPIGAAWMRNSLASCWISPRANESSGADPAGTFVYRTILDLQGYDPSSIQVQANVAVDNDLLAVRLNGRDLGLSASGFSGFAALAINGPFQSGANTLEFVVSNHNDPVPNPSGLRVEFSFVAPPQLSALASFRASQQDRDAWQDRLQGRIGQNEELAIELDSAVDAAEVALLAQLRDALVLAACYRLQPPTLYSTATNTAMVDGNRDLQTDQSWSIVSAPGGVPLGSAIVSSPPSSNWIDNGFWISPSLDENFRPNDPAGNYVYRTTWDMSGVDPATLSLGLNIAADNYVQDVVVNGVSLGLSGFRAQTATPITVNRGFVTATNTLDIVVQVLAPGSSGLNVEFTAIGFDGAIPVTADWLTQRLLIDVQGDSKTKTSRLLQATTMMQALFFALRNFEFQQISPLPDVASWALNELEATFDGEWLWMGTYPSWQSVMRVFLYPENLLQPTMRLDATGPSGEPRAVSETTKAFRDFATRLDSYGGSLTSDLAVKEANQYVADLNSQNPGGRPVYPDLPSELNPSQLAYSDPRSLTPRDIKSLHDYGQAALIKYAQNCDWVKYAFLWEGWYFVAVEIALQLQRAGQFEESLAWFRIVYAYDLPLTPPTTAGGAWSDSQRKIFYGLATETTVFQYLQSKEWLIDASNPHQIAPTRAFPYTRFTMLSTVQCLLDFADSQFSVETAESLSNALALYTDALNLLDEMQSVLPRDVVTDSNPVLASILQHARNSAAKLRSGLNIAGKLRAIPGTSIQPTAYRYATLIDRSKQLVGLAQQIETSYLAALQKGDEEAYNALKAQQDVETANATITLQTLQTDEANQGVILAQDQVQKAKDQEAHDQQLLDDGLSDQENAGLNMQWGKAIVEGIGAVAAVVGAFYTGGATLGAAEQLGQAAFSDSEGAINTQASYERRQQDWQFQRDQASDEIVIGNEQVAVAKGQQAIAAQELSIANLQGNHAQLTLAFLANKFTNTDLYRWMSSVLGNVYAYFLQQAAAMARLAQSQLAFERQEEALSIIQPNYWQPVASGGVNSGGLTGAERLLQDITALDQNAFETDQLKLQLTKTVSLSQLDPFAFQKFCETGLLRFATPMRLFDQDFPGQYLRLIKQVRVSVIALIPTINGIRATLANHGISRVVVQDDTEGFQVSVVQRDPELVALSAPANATGLFDLSSSGSQLANAATGTQSGLLLPFEDLGVDTSWELVMARAANGFDFSTIFDVLVTFDYTALYSDVYRKQVVRQLDQDVSADLGYSFRQQFADAWYALNNPGQSTTPMVVQFQTRLQDFPPNVDDMTIQQVVLYFVPQTGQTSVTQPTAALMLSGSDTGRNPEQAGGQATATEGIISTRRGNAPNWMDMIGLQVAGSWTLDLSDSSVKGLFDGSQIQDILFVITYSGRNPDWPT